jgi:hypothetical protein
MKTVSEPGHEARVPTRCRAMPSAEALGMARATSSGAGTVCCPLEEREHGGSPKFRQLEPESLRGS